MSDADLTTVWVVDDDMMSREVTALLLADAGFAARMHESGADALRSLRAGCAIPNAMLIDMQMPGVSGDALAAELRAACGPLTRLIAMSGAQVEPERRAGFDNFVMKPFDGEALVRSLRNPGDMPQAEETGLEERAALDSTSARDSTVALDPGVLSESTFLSLRQTMPAPQLRALYKLCLDDVDARLKTLRQASEARDADGFRRAAHSIKGGCGMVGALELARMATDFERRGMPAVDNVVPFQHFLEASARLRGMLGRVLDKAD